MRLSIHNIAKISSADLVLKGITVIAGNNNTGKSTIGKTLYALMEALSNWEERSKEGRMDRIMRILFSLNSSPFYYPDFDFGKDFLAGKLSDSDVLSQLSEGKKDDGTPLSYEDCEKCLAQMKEVKALSEDVLRNAFLSRYFSRAFYGQYLPIPERNDVSTVSFKEEIENIQVNFSKDRTEYCGNPNIVHSAYYIDGPQALDVLGRIRQGPGGGLNSDIRISSLMRAIEVQRKVHEKNPESAAVDDVITRNKLQSVNACFKNVLPGEVVYNKQGKYVFHDRAQNVDFELCNLSTGLKVFSLLQLLLGQGILQPGNILILDEPEVHLHPDWQLVYAEVIVLLRKHFDLTVLLTSHSSDLMDALQLFAAKYGIEEQLNAYIPVADTDIQGAIKVVPVEGNDWDKLYENFLPMMNRLNDLRSELKRD